MSSPSQNPWGLKNGFQTNKTGSIVEGMTRTPFDNSAGGKIYNATGERRIATRLDWNHNQIHRNLLANIDHNVSRTCQYRTDTTPIQSNPFIWIAHLTGKYRQLSVVRKRGVHYRESRKIFLAPYSTDYSGEERVLKRSQGRFSNLCTIIRGF